MVPGDPSSVQTVNSPDGFVVWSEGSHEDRELKYMKLEKGKGPVPSSKKTVCKKGVFSDIQCVISFDGKWVAFAREISHFDGRYDPPGDYHNFGNYDLYIVRIDGELPAEPQKVGHGYWPSWGDDSTGFPKTLYYSYTELYDSRSGPHDRIIRKITLNEDGSFTEPVEHVRCPGQFMDGHMQCAPNGRYVAYRTDETVSLDIYDIQEKRLVPGAGGLGCHPRWSPDSTYLIWAQNFVCVIKDGIGKDLGSACLDTYHYGFSNDMKWVIARIGGGFHQNTGADIVYKPLDTSNDGWKLGEGITIPDANGTWCDIHVW